MPELHRSQSLFERARQVIPGGVNSPVRSFGAVGGTPPFIREARGARLFDVDGNEYIDYVGSWGPMILGHAHPEVVEALREAAVRGTSYGAPTELEVELATAIVDAFPAMDLVRLVNSGTEATMSAIRLARGYTGRDRIVKFAGNYHGHVDSLLVQAGSGLATQGVPGSPGVTRGTTGDTLLLPYNDTAGVEELFAREGETIAAVIVEPVAGNMGLVPGKPQFLQALRRLTRQYGALLIFDEVISGFRFRYGGVQDEYGIAPDLTCLGKIIGGGLPVGAYGGRREIMESVSPLGPVYQAGTLSGNPLAMAAGLTTLRLLRRQGTYEELEKKGRRLAEGLAAAAREAELPVTLHRKGSAFTLFFTAGPVENFEDVKGADTERFRRYFHGMLDEGIYLAPSAFETGFVSLAHEEADLERTVAAAETVFQAIR